MVTSLKERKVQQSDMGERFLNAVATQSLRHLFTQVGDIGVEIQCSSPSQLFQGTIDGFKMWGRDLQIRRQFHTAEISFETDAVFLDVGSLLMGKIRLRQPTQAIARVVLTEAAINQAFEAALVKPRLSNLTDPALLRLSGGEPLSFRDVRVQLHPNRRVTLTAMTDLPNRANLPLGLTATLDIQKRRRLAFSAATPAVDHAPAELQPLSTLLSQALLEVLNAMVDLDRFDLDGILLRLNRLETEGDRLVFSGYAQVSHFPGMV